MTTRAQLAAERAALAAFMHSGASMGWTGQAACVNGDPRLFDPDEERTRISTATSRANSDEVAAGYCTSCTVRSECAAMRGGAAGVWGGVRHFAGFAVDLVAELAEQGRIAPRTERRRTPRERGSM